MDILWKNVKYDLFRYLMDISGTIFFVIQSQVDLQHLCIIVSSFDGGSFTPIWICWHVLNYNGRRRFFYVIHVTTKSIESVTHACAQNMSLEQTKWKVACTTCVSCVRGWKRMWRRVGSFVCVHFPCSRTMEPFCLRQG